MKTIITFLCMLFCVSYIYAQTNYYTTTKTFNENGYAYQCDVSSSKLVILYNKSNKWINVYPIYKSTGETFAQTDQGIDLLEYDNFPDSKYKSIVNAAFSPNEKQKVKGYDLTTIMYINSTTGKVDEVSFRFANFEPYATIPISVYRKIETELKNKILFTPTTEGNKLNYIYYWWSHEPQ